MDICTNTRIPMRKLSVKDKNILKALMDIFHKLASEHGIDLFI
jgi:hypothetical protein